jgi:drug/metabolite transporter (DMT)-like permease
MKPRDFAELLLLGALWGASFLFMRVAVPEFGPLTLAAVRVTLAALVLLPLAAARGELAALRRAWRPVAAVGLVNSALPFWLFNVAALVLGIGLMAILNATAPMWSLVVAWLWFGQLPTRERLAGLLLGLAGVIALSWSQADLHGGTAGVSPALGLALCVGATLAYGVGANLARRRLSSVPPLAVAAGSQAAASLVLLVPGIAAWPARWPSAAAWASAGALALACTALAYLLYFRLIARAGATSAISVTLLIPAFAMAWGALFLGEMPSLPMIGAGALILFGTALSTGLVARRRQVAA